MLTETEALLDWENCLLRKKIGVLRKELRRVNRTVECKTLRYHEMLRTHINVWKRERELEKMYGVSFSALSRLNMFAEKHPVWARLIGMWRY